MEYERELSVAKDIALKAGEVMLRYFDADQQEKTKTDDTPVTIADTSINTLVIAQLKSAFPDDGVIGEEESTSEYGEGRKWFCDPLDGTKAYTRGIPTAMFSLALVVDGRPVMGVAYDPFLKKMYEATEGLGSYCNGERLAVSPATLPGSWVAVTSTIKKLQTSPYIHNLEKEGAKLMSMSGGVVKGCLVARGKFVGYIGIEISAHDTAAVEVIVREAGGRVTDVKGETIDYTKPFKGAVLSNGTVHAKLIALLND